MPTKLRPTIEGQQKLSTMRDLVEAEVKKAAEDKVINRSDLITLGQSMDDASLGHNDRYELEDRSRGRHVLDALAKSYRAYVDGKGSAEFTPYAEQAVQREQRPRESSRGCDGGR
jgi:hypothetical protein